MPPIQQHRLKNIFLNLSIFAISLLCVIFLPAFELWGLFWHDFDHVRFNTMISNALAFLGIHLIISQFKRFAGTQSLSYIIPIVTLVYLAIFSYFLFTRFGYSRHVLLTGYTLNLIFAFMIHLLKKNYQKPNYALLTLGHIAPILAIQQQNFQLISIFKPSLPTVPIKAVITDLHAKELDTSWAKFLADCTLNHIPVFHVKQMLEMLTGRVQIEHLSENQFGSLLPSPFYILSKRILDIFIVFLILPITLPIMLITAIAIKLESSGNIFFIQNRVGQGNKDFKIYKFRSMFMDSEYNGAKLAQSDDNRVTKVGSWIRKTRIDELPQLWNVLKGDMSLIGPRPEQRTFVTQFEKNIPFYIYRHVVKPGMTGWAQVMQGYASNEDDTIVKIQYDFYYIKHFSFWLDILIFLKTVRVIITGYGAK